MYTLLASSIYTQFSEFRKSLRVRVCDVLNLRNGALTLRSNNFARAPRLAGGNYEGCMHGTEPKLDDAIENTCSPANGYSFTDWEY